jgi:hypothetical protein
MKKLMKKSCLKMDEAALAQLRQRRPANLTGLV